MSPFPAPAARVGAPVATPFGNTRQGLPIQLFTPQNAQGTHATVSTLGGTLTSLHRPGQHE